MKEDNITSFSLELPTLSSMTYNNKTKIVEAILILSLRTMKTPTIQTLDQQQLQIQQDKNVKHSF